MFVAFPDLSIAQHSDLKGPFPTSLVGWSNSQKLELSDDDTHLGFVLDGPATLIRRDDAFALSAGMYFSMATGGSVSGGRGIVVTRHSAKGLELIGGPVESTGRLRYIDGCSDTLLVSPPVEGDACLNLLHIPPGTNQTAHTHPSIRVGVVASGHGRCVTPDGEFPLDRGTAFVIEAETVHSFHTDESHLLVIAYHPDSDFGPRHDDHPMVNRTIVDGVSARNLDAIRTPTMEPHG